MPTKAKAKQNCVQRHEYEGNVDDFDNFLKPDQASWEGAVPDGGGGYDQVQDSSPLLSLPTGQDALSCLYRNPSHHPSL